MTQPDKLMSGHELARTLLASPDLPVKICIDGVLYGGDSLCTMLKKDAFITIKNGQQTAYGDISLFRIKIDYEDDA